MSKPKVVFLLDMSTSMDNHRRMIWKSMVDIYTKVASRCDFGVAIFHSVYNKIDWNHSPIDTRSTGGTRLYGSVIDCIRELTRQFDNSDKVMIVVVTDGEHQQEYRYIDQDPLFTATTKDVMDEVHTAEQVLGWDFLFVGTNINAYRVGATMGVKTTKALSFVNSSNGFNEMLKGLSDITDRWVDGNIGHDADFFTEQRSIQERLGAVQFS